MKREETLYTQKESQNYKIIDGQTDVQDEVVFLMIVKNHSLLLSPSIKKKFWDRHKPKNSLKIPNLR